MTRPLRGRADELARGLAALRTAREGRSAVTVVTGEPGIGKSALAGAVAEQAARQGFAVAESQAHETDDVTPLASLGPALRFGAEPLLTSAQFLELAGLTAQPLWLAERLATFLEARARDRPVLLVLDDAQWTDPLSVFTLRILPKRLRNSPPAFCPSKVYSCPTTSSAAVPLRYTSALSEPSALASTATRRMWVAGSASRNTGRKMPPKIQKSPRRSASFTDSLAECLATVASSRLVLPYFSSLGMSYLKR